MPKKLDRLFPDACCKKEGYTAFFVRPRQSDPQRKSPLPQPMLVEGRTPDSTLALDSGEVLSKNLDEAHAAKRQIRT